MTNSAFDYFTTLSSEESPTELIQNLILVIGHDACSVRQDMQTLYHLVSRARDIADAVNALIDKVNEGSPNSRNDFNKYNQVIEPLEE